MAATALVRVQAVCSADRQGAWLAAARARSETHAIGGEVAALEVVIVVAVRNVVPSVSSRIAPALYPFGVIKGAPRVRPFHDAEDDEQQYTDNAAAEAA